MVMLHTTCSRDRASLSTITDVSGLLRSSNPLPSAFYLAPVLMQTYVTIEEIVKAPCSTSPFPLIENRSLAMIGLTRRLVHGHCRTSRIPVTLLMPPRVNLQLDNVLEDS
jgi:hypothetical protein